MPESLRPPNAELLAPANPCLSSPLLVTFCSAPVVYFYSALDKLGIAIARDAYERYRTLLDSPRWECILNAGAHPQRLLWASTGTKDPKASEILYVQALARPLTVNTMPEVTLKALADHEEFGEASPAHEGEVLAEFAKAGINTDAVAAHLLEEGVDSFAKSWDDLLACIASKSETLKSS